jgi:hypothetical protein
LNKKIRKCEGKEEGESENENEAKETDSYSINSHCPVYVRGCKCRFAEICVFLSG